MEHVQEDRWYGNHSYLCEDLNGKRNGKGKEYHENGKVQFSGTYLNGERNGKGTEYNYDGTIKYDAISEGEYGLVFEKDYDYYMKYNFDNIINPEDISALLFIKEVPIDYMNPSEEDFYVIELND